MREIKIADQSPVAADDGPVFEEKVTTASTVDDGNGNVVVVKKEAGVIKKKVKMDDSENAEISTDSGKNLINGSRPSVLQGSKQRRQILASIGQPPRPTRVMWTGGRRGFESRSLDRSDFRSPFSRSIVVPMEDGTVTAKSGGDDSTNGETFRDDSSRREFIEKLRHFENLTVATSGQSNNNNAREGASTRTPSVDSSRDRRKIDSKPVPLSKRPLPPVPSAPPKPPYQPHPEIETRLRFFDAAFGRHPNLRDRQLEHLVNPATAINDEDNTIMSASLMATGSHDDSQVGYSSASGRHSVDIMSQSMTTTLPSASRQRIDVLNRISNQLLMTSQPIVQEVAQEQPKPQRKNEASTKLQATEAELQRELANLDMMLSDIQQDNNGQNEQSECETTSPLTSLARARRHSVAGTGGNRLTTPRVHTTVTVVPPPVAMTRSFVITDSGQIPSRTVVNLPPQALRNEIQNFRRFPKKSDKEPSLSTLPQQTESDRVVHSASPPRTMPSNSNNNSSCERNSPLSTSAQNRAQSSSPSPSTVKTRKVVLVRKPPQSTTPSTSNNASPTLGESKQQRSSPLVTAGQTDENSRLQQQQSGLPSPPTSSSSRSEQEEEEVANHEDEKSSTYPPPPTPSPPSRQNANSSEPSTPPPLNDQDEKLNCSKGEEDFEEKNTNEQSISNDVATTCVESTVCRSNGIVIAAITETGMTRNGGIVPPLSATSVIETGQPSPSLTPSTSESNGSVSNAVIGFSGGINQIPQLNSPSFSGQRQYQKQLKDIATLRHCLVDIETQQQNILQEVSALRNEATAISEVEKVKEDLKTAELRFELERERAQTRLNSAKVKAHGAALELQNLEDKHSVGQTDHENEDDEALQNCRQHLLQLQEDVDEAEFELDEAEIRHKSEHDRLITRLNTANEAALNAKSNNINTMGGYSCDFWVKRLTEHYRQLETKKQLILRSLAKLQQTLVPPNSSATTVSNSNNTEFSFGDSSSEKSSSISKECDISISNSTQTHVTVAESTHSSSDHNSSVRDESVKKSDSQESENPGPVTLRKNVNKQQISASERPRTIFLPQPDNPSLDLRELLDALSHDWRSCSHVSLSGDGTVCRGWLHKLSRKIQPLMRPWARRWFVFDRQRSQLCYFSDSNESNARERIPFSCILDVYVETAPSTGGLSSHAAHRSVRPPNGCSNLLIVVSTLDRKLVLAGPSPQAARIWVDVLCSGAAGNQSYEELCR